MRGSPGRTKWSGTHLARYVHMRATWSMISWGERGSIRGGPRWIPVRRGCTCPHRRKCYHAKWKPTQPHAVSDAQHSCLALCGKPQSGCHREQMMLAKQARHALSPRERTLHADGRFWIRIQAAIRNHCTGRDPRVLERAAERGTSLDMWASPGRERWIGRRSDARSGASSSLYSWTGSPILALHRIYQRGSNQRGTSHPDHGSGPRPGVSTTCVLEMAENAAERSDGGGGRGGVRACVRSGDEAVRCV